MRAWLWTSDRQEGLCPVRPSGDGDASMCGRMNTTIADDRLSQVNWEISANNSAESDWRNYRKKWVVGKRGNRPDIAGIAWFSGLDQTVELNSFPENGALVC